MRRVARSIAIFLLLFGLIRLYYHLTDDFRLANITCSFPFQPSSPFPALSDNEHQDLQRILSQTFSYIGKGAQCYAFVSKDQQYVLKFFKFKHLKPNVWITLLPSISFFKEYKEAYIKRKQRKLIGVFNSHDLAFREYGKGSGLIYTHLLPTQHLQLKARLTDKMGLERVVHLDEVVFLLQRKGETLRTRMHALLKQGSLEEAKQIIGSILEMYILEYQNGLYDHDHGVMHNTGFIENQPFHLDVGKLNKDERMREVKFYKKDLEHVIWKIDTWVKSSYPCYYLELSDFLMQQYERWTGEGIDIQTIDPKRFKKTRRIEF